MNRGLTSAGVSYFLTRFGGGLTLFFHALAKLIKGTVMSVHSCLRADKTLAVLYCRANIGAQGVFLLRYMAVWENRLAIRTLFVLFVAIIVEAFVFFSAVH